MSHHHADGLSPDRGPAPAFPPHHFSPDAVMARATSKLAQVEPVSPAEVLAAIAAEIDGGRA